MAIRDTDIEGRQNLKAAKKGRPIYDDPNVIREAQAMAPRSPGMGDIRMKDEAALQQPVTPTPVAPPRMTDQQMVSEYKQLNPDMVGPDPVQARSAAINSQTNIRNAQIQANSAGYVRNKLAGAASEAERINMVRQNNALRGENDLARSASVPVPTPLTPDANAVNARRSDLMLMEQAQAQLASMAPTDPDRARYESVVNNYREKLMGSSPNRSLGIALGDPSSVAQGFAQSVAGYQDRGQKATASQTNAAANRALLNADNETAYTQMYNTRKTGEAWQKAAVDADRRIARGQWDAAEQEAQANAAAYRASTAKSNYESSPQYISSMDKLRNAEIKTQLAKAETERRAASGSGGTQPVDAENFAKQSVAARQRFGITDEAVKSTTEAINTIGQAFSGSSRGVVDGTGIGGSVDDQLRSADGVLSFAERLKSMADAGNREVAASLADEVFRSMPRTNNSGQYKSVDEGDNLSSGYGATGVFAAYIRNVLRRPYSKDRDELVNKLTKAKEILGSLRGQP